MNQLRIQNKQSSKDNKYSQKKKAEFSFFDRHVVKPIRGGIVFLTYIVTKSLGGGDASNFAKNNLFAFDKPPKSDYLPEEKKTVIPDLKQTKAEPSIKENIKSENAKEDQSFKKIESRLKQKGNMLAKKLKPLMNTKTDTDTQEEEEDDGSSEESTQKLKTSQNTKVIQKGMKSLISGVKNLFS
jgi:hypothetical protein